MAPVIASEAKQSTVPPLPPYLVNLRSPRAGWLRFARHDGDARLTPTLETRALTIRFGGHVAVDGVTCAFQPGELAAIVGPNGAGKTAYFNLISGQLRASAGAVLVRGLDVTRLYAPRRARSGLAARFSSQTCFRGSACSRTCGWPVRRAPACIMR